MTRDGICGTDAATGTTPHHPPWEAWAGFQNEALRTSPPTLGSPERAVLGIAKMQSTPPTSSDARAPTGESRLGSIGHADESMPSEAGGPGMHTTVITSDVPVEVHVGDRGGYWFKIWVSVIQSGAWASLSPTAAKVYVTLARYANGNPSLACWPSSGTLERDGGLSRSAVFRALAELVSAGLVVRRLSGGGTTTTTFQLVEPRGSGHVAPRSSTTAEAPEVGRPSGGTANPTRPRNGTGTRPRNGTTPVPEMGRDIDPENKNSSSAIGADAAPRSGQAAAAALLKAEGFGAADVECLAAHGHERVRDAIDNCDLLQKSGRLRAGRRAYIARAISDGYSLYEGVEKARIPAAARRLPELVRAVASAEELEALNTAFPSQASIESVFRRGILRPGDLDAMAPDDILRKLQSLTR